MKYFIVSGEASGDLHAANLMKELQKKDKNAAFYFLGGDKMVAVGGVMFRHYKDMAFMGFLSILKNSRRIVQNFKICQKAILDVKPDVVVLVDYPGFNLRIAKFVKRHTAIPVVYYIAPKLWAWKSYRIRDIRKYVDLMITIFPFETPFFGKFNYAVAYAGNPSVDTVFEGLGAISDENVFRESNRLSDKPIIALLPGSRLQEIKSCLPKMFEAAQRYKTHQIVIAASDSIQKEVYAGAIEMKEAKLVYSQTYSLLKYADLAVVNSGTATLETALINTPQVVVYEVMLGRFGILMKDLFIKTKFVSLVNIIAGKEVVRELLGYLFTVENLAKEINKLIDNKDYRASITEGYAEIKKILGEKGTSKNAAGFIMDYLDKNSTK